MAGRPIAAGGWKPRINGTRPSRRPAEPVLGPAGGRTRGRPPQDEENFLMPSTTYLMLRSAQRARLEARTMLIQHSHPLVEFVEQRLCVFEIRRVEAFGEPS